MDIIDELKAKVKAGTVIPKPDAKADFIVKGWGVRRREEAMIYQIPNHDKPDKPHAKCVTVSEWRHAYRLAGGDIFDASRSRPFLATMPRTPLYVLPTHHQRVTVHTAHLY
jgi:hypothetical protein